MNKAIELIIAESSHCPGVYKMVGESGVALYIGKAKDLKKRLRQYSGTLTERLQLMIQQVTKVILLKTDTEIEALILESKLIRELKPKYNIALKDDKSYPMITHSHDFPRLMKYRGGRTKGCYGPFPFVHSLHNMLSLLHKTFQLRSCSDRYFINRKQACLEYQLKRCSAPCVGHNLLRSIMCL